MAEIKGTNVTKYDAGGSGDDVISDGYIKAVEKIWLDDYTMAQTSTNNTLIIARLPQNKKITSIDITVETTASQSSHTLSLGYATDAAVDTLLGPLTISHALTASSVNLPGIGVSYGAVAGQLIVSGEKGFQDVTTGSQTDIALKLNNWTSSSGTIKSIVRYT